MKSHRGASENELTTAFSDDRLRSRKSRTAFLSTFVHGSKGASTPETTDISEHKLPFNHTSGLPLYSSVACDTRQSSSARSTGRNPRCSKVPKVFLPVLMLWSADCFKKCNPMLSLHTGKHSLAAGMWPRRIHWCTCLAFVTVLASMILVLNLFSARRVDHQLTFRVMRQHFAAQELSLRELGVILPRVKVDYANVIDTHAAIREILIRREIRASTLQQLERTALQCSEATSNEGMKCPMTITKSLFVPSHFGWQMPRPSYLSSRNITVLKYDDIEMRQLIEDASLILDPSISNTPDSRALLLTLYDRLRDERDKVQLWSLCAIYMYGGMFLGSVRDSNLHDQQILHDTLFGSSQTTSIVDQQLPSPVAIVISTERQISLLAATPRHGNLGNLLVDLTHFVANEVGKDEQIGLFPHGFHEHMVDRTRVDVSGSLHDAWQRWSRPDGTCWLSSGVTELGVTAMTREKGLLEQMRPDGCSLFTIVTSSKSETKEKANDDTARVVSVSVVQRTYTSNNADVIRPKQRKVSLQSRMRNMSIEPGWLCNRCLNWAFFGTYERCSRVCPHGYKELMCDTPDFENIATVDVDVVVRGWPKSFDGLTRSIIPRIIHQTWFEEITFDTYPQLARLQLSWKESGWEFRFYTDDSARKYIMQHFPTRFVDAFDALIHGAYKADFFRYLVLMREGGIYADIDVKLEGSLDTLIAPSTTFFAPRDIPCEYAGEPFCLWNGFVGSAPGNPIVVRAAERMINFIQQRADIYDMERETCRLSQSLSHSVWKIRAQPLLFLSGPCALGVAMNEAHRRPLLGNIPIGWSGAEDLQYEGLKDVGESLVLVGDKYDLGEFRISHPESGAIVAATDIDGLDKSRRRVQHPTTGDLRRLAFERKILPHYSNSKKGVTIWGMTNVYIDDQIVNERVRFHLRFVA